MKRQRKQSKPFRTAIAISAIIHAVILITLAVSPEVVFLFREKPVRISMIWVELPRGTSDDIGLGIKKSEGLPKSTIEEQKKLFQPEQQALAPKMKGPVTKKEEKPKKRPKVKVPKKARVTRTTNRKMRNALAKIDRQLKDRQITPEAAQIEENTDGYKYGTSDKPLRVLPSDPEYLKYQAMVRAKIIREWVIPSAYTADGAGALNASVEVLINTSGDVVSVRWIHPSGNNSFDQSAVRAVRRASPFPKPPDRLAWEAYNEGFMIEFDTRLKPRY